jgi:hypothetical protein
LKKFLLSIIFLVIFVVTSVAYADEWTYAGKFVLRTDIPHANDTLILDHLTKYSGQALGNGGYAAYDVYYHHDHAYDSYREESEEIYASYNIQGKVVPLDAHGKSLNVSGLQAGTIISDITIANQGAFSVVSNNFRVFDKVTHQLLFSTSKRVARELLYSDSAAETIARLSAPHPAVPVWPAGPKGSVPYPKR